MQRLARNARFSERVLAEHDPALHVIDNSGPLEHTVEHLLACVDGQPVCA